MLDVALFLNRLDLDAVQFSCKRHRTFVRDNAHLIPLRDLAGIRFENNPLVGGVKVLVQLMEQSRRWAGIVQLVELNGSWDEVLDEKDEFRNAVRYSAPRRLELATL